MVLNKYKMDKLGDVISNQKCCNYDPGRRYLEFLALVITLQWLSIVNVLGQKHTWPCVCFSPVSAFIE